MTRTRTIRTLLRTSFCTLFLLLGGCQGQSITNFMEQNVERIKIEEADMILTFMDAYYDKRTDCWTIYGNNGALMSQVQHWVMPYPDLSNENINLLLLEEPLEEFLAVFTYLAADLMGGEDIASVTGSAYFEPLNLIVLDVTKSNMIERSFWQEVGRIYLAQLKERQPNINYAAIIKQEQSLVPFGLLDKSSDENYFPQLFGYYMTDQLNGTKMQELGMTETLTILNKIREFLF